MFTKEQLEKNIYRILCPGDVYAYFIEGSKRALLIDTGLGYGDLKAFIDSFTDKPYDVVLTHGHLDHAGGSYSFENVYVNEKDMEMLPLHTDVSVRKGYFTPKGIDVDESLLLPRREKEYLKLVDEQIFDLGDVSVQALPMPGHTKGSMAMLIMPYRYILFGDACNSMTFMQFEDCLSIEEYGLALQEFKSKYEDLYDVIYYSHPHNYGGKEILDQMIEVCDLLVSGKIEGIPFVRNAYIALPFNEDMKRVDGKIANIAFMKNNVRKL